MIKRNFQIDSTMYEFPLSAMEDYSLMQSTVFYFGGTLELYSRNDDVLETETEQTKANFTGCISSK